MRILVINGPNINMLGIREPGIYGKGTYTDLCGMINNYAAEKGVEVKLFQSNHEGAIVDEIQNALGSFLVDRCAEMISPKSDARYQKLCFPKQYHKNPSVSVFSIA